MLEAVGLGRRPVPKPVSLLEAQYLAQTDGRLFVRALAVEDIESLALDADLAERVDAFVARFVRLQDTLAGALNAAHAGVEDLVSAAALMAAQARVNV